MIAIVMVGVWDLDVARARPRGVTRLHGGGAEDGAGRQARFGCWSIAFCIAAPVSGRSCFARGFLYRGWAESLLGVAGAIVLSSLVWTSLHLQYDWFFLERGVFDRRSCSAICAIAATRRWLTIVLHGLNNLAATLQTLLAGRGNRKLLSPTGRMIAGHARSEPHPTFASRRCRGKIDMSDFENAKSPASVSPRPPRTVGLHGNDVGQPARLRRFHLSRRSSSSKRHIGRCEARYSAHPRIFEHWRSRVAWILPPTFWLVYPRLQCFGSPSEWQTGSSPNILR